MTTKVTVDAHAGWPVKVEAVYTYEGKTETSELQVVPPGQIQEFYATDTQQILVTELKR